MLHSAIPMAEKPKKKLFTRRRIIILLLLAAAFLGTGFYFYRGPGRPMVDEWRAGSHLEEAKQLEESEQWVSSFQQATESMRLKPSLEAIRLIVRTGRIVGDRQILKRSLQLFQFDGATLDDRVLALRISLDLKALNAANILVGELTPEELKEPLIRFQLVRGALMSGNLKQALAIADQEAGQNDPVIDLMLAVNLARTGIEATKPEIDKRLRNVIQSKDATLSIGGFELLVSLNPSWVQKSLLEAAIERFDGDENLKPIHELHLEYLKTSVGRQDLEATVSKAIEDYRETHLKDLVVWLAKIGRFEEILEVTTEEEVQKDAKVFELRLTALEITKDWAELRSALEEPPVTVPEPLLLALQALVDSKQGEMLPAQSKWKMSMVKAWDDTERNWFYQLSQVAARAENKDMQMEMLVRAITRKDGIPPRTDVLSPLFKWLVEMKDEKRLLDVSEQLLRREPNHPLLANNFLYLKALYRKPESKDAEIMKEIVKTYPDKIQFRNSLAMVQLMLEDYQTALDTLEVKSEENTKSIDLVRAMKAHGLFGLGQQKEARTLAEAVDWSKLMSQEAEVLKLPPAPEEIHKSIYEKALYQQVDEKDAKTLEELVKAEPDNLVFRRSLVLVQLILEEYQTALAALDTLAEVGEGTSDQIRAMRAHTLFGLGKKKEARALAETVDWTKLNSRERKILELPPPPEELNKSIYDKALYRTARAKDAETLEELLKSDPDNAAFRRSLAMVQLVLKKHQAALETLDALSEESEKHGDLLRAMRAKALLGLGQEEKARALAESVDWTKLNSRERKVLELPPLEEDE